MGGPGQRRFGQVDGKQDRARAGGAVLWGTSPTSVETEGGSTGRALSAADSRMESGGQGLGWVGVGCRGSARATLTVRCIQVETPGRLWAFQA